MAELDQLTASTRRFIRDNPALVDSVFNRDPFFAYCKQNLKEAFGGGYLIQEGIIFDGLIGGPYAKGKDFDITEKQVEQAKQFNIKFWEVNVTLSKEDIQVLNTGPLAVYDLVKTRMTAAYMTMGAQMAILLYMNGIRAGFEANINGLAEMLNDGSTASLDNSTYTTYGGLTRGGQIGRALNSVPVNVNAPIDYNQLETTYGAATYGSDEPNLGVTTVIGYSSIKNQFQTQQRFNDTQDPAIGFNGLKFNSATLTKSRYVPGSDIVTAGSDSNKIAVTALQQMSNGAINTYPALAVASSETLFWVNARQPYLNFYVSSNPEYQFGFTGFKVAQGNTKVAGQVLASVQVTGEPRYHKQVYGWT